MYTCIDFPDFESVKNGHEIKQIGHQKVCKMNRHQTLLFWFNQQRIKNEKAAIYLRLTVNGRRTEFSTDQYIEPGA